MSTFTAGTLCCSADACVLIDVNSSYSVETWDLIPHVTDISVNSVANTPKIITSSTGGREVGACGSITETGTLGIACHNSNDQPSILCINKLYHIRWTESCDNIWDAGTDTAIAIGLLNAAKYFDGIIRITGVPVNFNIKGNAVIEITYTFDIVKWHNYPTCQAAEATS